MLKFILKWFDSKDFEIASPQALKKKLDSLFKTVDSFIFEIGKTK
jgi:hypothetical protein